ncbi:MAG: hypothetical protein ACRD4M_11805 [Candidatus Acidiferrales bacterium]
MAAASKHNERKGNGSKASSKRATSARESLRTQTRERARSGSSAITIHAAEEEVVRRPRMELADALRARGVDEHRLAELYVLLFNNVARAISKGADPKRSLDNVKEFGRVLESKRANDRAGDRGGAQVLVQLVHQVARPERGMEALATPREGNAEEMNGRISPTRESFAPEMCAVDVLAGEARAEIDFAGRD